MTQELLKTLLDYDPDTGIFKWKKKLAQCIHIGDQAGRKNNKGYWHINIYGKCYKAHRLAWLYMYGAWPKDQIDHKNKIKDDNRIDNLREANGSDSMANRPPWRKGLKGAVRAGKKWVASIRKNYKYIYLGIFDTEQEAHQAYLEAAQSIHGEFASA